MYFMLIEANVWNNGNDDHSGDHSGENGSKNARECYCVEIPVEFDVVIVTLVSISICRSRGWRGSIGMAVLLCGWATNSVRGILGDTSVVRRTQLSRLQEHQQLDSELVGEAYEF